MKHRCVAHFYFRIRIVQAANHKLLAQANTKSYR